MVSKQKRSKKKIVKSKKVYRQENIGESDDIDISGEPNDNTNKLDDSDIDLDSDNLYMFSDEFSDDETFGKRGKKYKNHLGKRGKKSKKKKKKKKRRKNVS